MTHACPISNCSIDVAAHMFMCARHWRMVPKPLQAAVYESYRSTGRVSENHREAIRVVTRAEAGRKALELPAGTKALTVWQPWASLIIIGAKPWEFRGWKFTDKPHLAKLVGQRIVIHAGTRRPRLSELDDLLLRIEEGESALDADLATPLVTQLRHAIKARGEDASLHMAPLGVALGTAVVGEPRNVVDIFRDQVADSDRLDDSKYGWPLSAIEKFPEPIPAMGAQGFWNWS